LAKKSMIAKQKRKPKFSTRNITDVKYVEDLVDI